MKFRKRPLVVEAIQWTGENWSDVWKFINGSDHMVRYVQNIDRTVKIKTLEGTMRASVNDWIIRGAAGELYPCKADIFQAIYDAVSE